MKARIKKTGEIVNLSPYAMITLDMCDSWGNHIELKPEEIELIQNKQDKTDDFDWQTFRAEAAKDILCGMLNTRLYDNAQRKQGCVEEAIYFADELIRQLKEKEVRND